MKSTLLLIGSAAHSVVGYMEKAMAAEKPLVWTVLIAIYIYNKYIKYLFKSILMPHVNRKCVFETTTWVVHQFY